MYILRVPRYSQTWFTRPPRGNFESGNLRQVASYSSSAPKSHSNIICVVTEFINSLFYDSWLWFSRKLFSILFLCEKGVRNIYHNGFLAHFPSMWSTVCHTVKTFYSWNIHFCLFNVIFKPNVIFVKAFNCRKPLFISFLFIKIHLITCNL